MPTRAQAVTIAAGAFVNILAGTRYAQAGVRGAAYRLYIVQDGASEVVVDATVGTTLWIDGGRAPVVVAGAGPNRDEHLMSEGRASPLDPVEINVRNNDPVNAANVRYILDIAL